MRDICPGLQCVTLWQRYIGIAHRESANRNPQNLPSSPEAELKKRTTTIFSPQRLTVIVTSGRTSERNLSHLRRMHM
ncbi:T-complex protein 1 subunit zeta [Fusarium oxysporum f. sp. albedinis]|nr:T-complex protein 1 subunit zeta [Fusarium oxysporum f. sp. albedinis]